MNNINHSIKDNSISNQAGTFFTMQKQNQLLMNNNQYHLNYPSQIFANNQINFQRNGLNGQQQLSYGNPNPNYNQPNNQGNMIRNNNQMINMSNYTMSNQGKIQNQEGSFNQKIMMSQNMQNRSGMNVIKGNSPITSINNQPKMNMTMGNILSISHVTQQHQSKNNILNLPPQTKMYTNNHNQMNNNISLNGTQSPIGISMTIPNNNMSQMTPSNSSLSSLPLIKITSDGDNCQKSTSRSPNISTSGSPSSPSQFYPGGFNLGKNDVKTSPMSNDILRTPRSQFVNTSPGGSPNTIRLPGGNFSQMSPLSLQMNGIGQMGQLSPISEINKISQPINLMNNSPLPLSPNEQNQMMAAYQMQMLSQRGKQQHQQQINYYHNNTNTIPIPNNNQYIYSSISQMNNNLNLYQNNSFPINNLQSSNILMMRHQNQNQKTIPNMTFKHNVTVTNDKKFGKGKSAKSEQNDLNRLNSLTSKTTTEVPLSDKFHLLDFLPQQIKKFEHKQTILIIRLKLENNQVKIIEYKQDDNLYELLLKEFKSTAEISKKKFNVILEKIRNVLNETGELYLKTMTLKDMKKMIIMKNCIKEGKNANHGICNKEEDICNMSCDHEYNDYLQDFCHCLLHDHNDDNYKKKLDITF